MTVMIDWFFWWNIIKVRCSRSSTYLFEESLQPDYFWPWAFLCIRRVNLRNSEKISLTMSRPSSNCSCSCFLRYEPFSSFSLSTLFCWHFLSEVNSHFAPLVTISLSNGYSTFSILMSKAVSFITLLTVLKYEGPEINSSTF